MSEPTLEKLQFYSGPATNSVAWGHHRKESGAEPARIILLQPTENLQQNNLKRHSESYLERERVNGGAN